MDISSNDHSLEPPAYTPGRTTLWNNSWRDIYDHFAQAILAYSRRAGLNEHSAEDVLQEVMTTLIRCQRGQEPGFNPAGGNFQAWLWGVIKNRVRSVRRKDQKETAACPLEEGNSDAGEVRKLREIPQPPPDFEQMDESEWQRALLAAALRKIQTRVTTKNFSIYTSLLEEKASVETLADANGMKANAIYAIKHRCDEMLIKEARILREAWEGLR